MVLGVFEELPRPHLHPDIRHTRFSYTTDISVYAVFRCLSPLSSLYFKPQNKLCTSKPRRRISGGQCFSRALQCSSRCSAHELGAAELAKAGFITRFAHTTAKADRKSRSDGCLREDWKVDGVTWAMQGQCRDILMHFHKIWCFQTP